MHILVTGGAGYIGSHTVKALLAAGHTVTVADNLVYGHREAVDSRAAFTEAELMDPASLNAVFAKDRFDAVIHFAAYAYVGESVADPAKYYFNNVAGTMNLLEAMRKNGVPKIVFSSTCATYGEPLKTPIDETHPQNPINPYGRTKLMIEQIFADYEKAYGLRHISLRYFNAAGASSDASIGESHSPETHLIPLVLQAIKGERDAISVFGNDYPTPDGTCIRDYIHVEDLADAHVKALSALDSFTGAVNLGTGRGTSVLEIIKAAEKVSGKTCPVKIAGRRPGDPAVLYADNTKAKQVLGWTPVYTDIADIVASAWRWETSRRF
ncbi:MAG: UDP-glucose 4-epimerase GalE [Thermoguttaceae bacterium]|nr:UDP-glucose 4-epimerase GalE [Thermoguttaceae bacterium]